MAQYGGSDFEEETEVATRVPSFPPAVEPLVADGNEVVIVFQPPAVEPLSAGDMTESTKARLDKPLPTDSPLEAEQGVLEIPIVGTVRRSRWDTPDPEPVEPPGEGMAKSPTDGEPTVQTGAQRPSSGRNPGGYPCGAPGYRRYDGTGGITCPCPAITARTPG